MKLAIYIPVIETKPGGLGTYVRETCSRIIAEVGEVCVYTTTPETVPQSWNVEVCAPSKSNVSVADRFVWLNTTARRDMLRRGIDRIFVPTHEGLIAPPVPQVVVVHDLTMLVWPSEYFSPLLIAYMRMLLPTVLRASRCVAVSENTRRDIATELRMDESEIEVVYEGFDEAIFFPLKPRQIEATLAELGLRSTPYLLYSGTFAPHKNTKFLADVVRSLVDRGEEVEMVFTGRLDVGRFDETRARFAELGVADRIRSVGYVSYEQLSSLMRGATAFLFPSLYEGFGLAPLEAMASGAAVVCSNKASLPEVMGEAGYTLAPENADSWAEAVVELLEPTFRMSTQDNCRQRALSFSWTRATDRLLELLGD